MDTPGSTVSSINSSDANNLLKDLLNVGLGASQLTGTMESKSNTGGTGNSQNLADLVNLSGPMIPAAMNTQQIFLQGNDNANSFSVYGQHITVITSNASSSLEPSIGSNKVQIHPIANYDWVSKYYTGNLVSAHKRGVYVAYVLKGKIGGLIRVLNRKTEDRGLIKSFGTSILDIAFSHADDIILAAVDAKGNFQVHEVIQGVDSGKIETVCLLNVIRPASTPPSEYHRIIWCPYIPDVDEESDELEHSVSKLLMVSMDEVAEVWHVDIVKEKHGDGPLRPDEVESGFIAIREHTAPIVDATFSPDGTALATASLDGNVKFHQVYMYTLDKNTESRCLHVWQPHDGKPVSSINFLDNHKEPNPDMQFWKYIVTGGDNNQEIKIWSCETWTCLQTIRFSVAPDLPSNFYVEPCLKACTDLSANYLVMSDIRRKVLYILQLYQDAESNVAHISSISEFLLTQPVLSFAVLDARCKKFKRNEEENEDDLSDNEEDEDNEDTSTVGVVIKLYSVDPKAFQELTIQFHPESSVPQPIPASISSISQDGTGLQDGLTDVSMNTTVTSEEVESSARDDTPRSAGKPFLLTPAAFTSSPKRTSDSPSFDTHRSVTTSSSFTQVTELLNGEGVTPHSSVEQPILSPNNSIIKTPTSISTNSRTLSPNDLQVLTPTSLPLPPVTPGEQNNYAMGLPFEKSGVPPVDAVDEMFTMADAGRHGIKSGSSSSSTSLEVSEIMSGDVKPGEGQGYLDEAEEEQGDAITQKTELPPSGGKFINPNPYDAAIWPKPPKTGKRPDTPPNTDSGDDGDVTQDEEGEDDLSEPSPKVTTVQNHLLQGDMSQVQNSLQDILAILQVQQQDIYELRTEFQQQQHLLSEDPEDSKWQAYKQETERAIVTSVQNALKEHSQEENQRLRQALKERESQWKGREEKLSANLTQALTTSLSQKVDKTIKAEVKHILLPSITKSLDPVKEQLHTEMVQKLTATDAVVKENIAKLIRSKQTIDSIGHAAGNAIQASFRDTFMSIVVPSFERACGNMMKQVNETFAAGTKEHIRQLESQLEKVQQAHQEQRDPAVAKLHSSAENFTKTAEHLQSSISHVIKEQLSWQLNQSMASLQESISRDMRTLVKEEINDAMKDQQTAVTENLMAAMRVSGASTPIPLPPDPQQQKTQIMQLLRNGQINAAFQQALSAADLQLVMYVCESIEPAQLFNQTPCPLMQPVLLSLIQQLSADLESSTELKHKYLEEAVMNLDTTNRITTEHMPKVLNGLVQSLNDYISENPSGTMARAMKMLLMATQSLLR